MPAQTGQNNFLAKVGNRLDAAVKAHANDETDYGFQRLPGGISNGVAKLTECGFFEYKQGSNMKKVDGSSAVGEYFFRAAGTVVQPVKVRTPDGEVVVEGMQTSVMVPVLDTKKSDGTVTPVAEHIATVMNELRKLGADTKSMKTAASLPAVCQTLKKQAPYFHFSTSVGKEDPSRINPATGKPWPARVWENWNGVRGLDGYVPPEDSAVDDETIVTPGVNGHAPSDAGGGEYTDQGDIDSLLELARDSDDGDAQQKLVDLAIAAGYTEDEARGTDTWEELVEMINTPKEGGGSEGGEEWEPPVGDVFPVRLEEWDAGKKKMIKAKKAVNCEVLTVDNVGKTVTLKNLVTGKVHAGKDKKPARVSWDDLERS